MVLYPRDTTASGNTVPVQAWDAVEERQHAVASRFLLISQPHHARVSGQIAENMTASGLTPLSADVIRAIGLHDQGWQEFDHPSRVANGRPQSFVDVAPRDFLNAWAASIRTAQGISPIAGYVISSHFRWLAEFRLRTVPDPPEIYEPLDDFAMQERLREKRLLAADGRSASSAERLISVLQFCDLLSLYLCCGATRPAVFPQALFDNADQRIAIQHMGETAFALTPSPFQSPVELRVKATGYPETAQSHTLTWTLR